MSCGLTLEEVHQASYLTLKGWTYTSYEGWKKEGFTRTTRQWAGCCSGCEKEVEVDTFDRTEDAYYRQLESEGA